jgi:RimJ/RimL family protein N-acetyltransferase
MMRSVDRVETERLLLRRWRVEDLDSLVRVLKKPEVWWFPFQRGLTTEETEAFLGRKLDEWESRGWSQWAAESKDDRALIGFIGLSPPDFLPEVMPTVEVGFRLDPGYWGRGLATEGALAALEFGFNVLGLDEIVSIYEPLNVASGRVMERLGMLHDRDTTHPAHGVPLRVFKVRRDQWHPTSAHL